MTIILQTDEVQAILQEAGLKRDDCVPYSTGVAYTDGKCVFILDESFTYQDLNFLIEDCEISGIHSVASLFKKLKADFETIKEEEEKNTRSSKQ